MTNPTKDFLDDVAGYAAAPAPENRLGTIDSGYTTGRPRVLFDGETVLGGKTYPFLASYTPKASERVLLAPMGSSFVVLGTVGSTTGYAPRAFRAKYTGSAAFGAGSNTTLTLTQDFNDDPTTFGLAADNVTVNILQAGLYLIEWSVGFGSTAAGIMSAYLNNNFGAVTGYYTATASNVLRGTQVLRAAANSGFTLNLFANAAGSLTNAPHDNQVAVVRLA